VNRIGGAPVGTLVTPVSGGFTNPNPPLPPASYSLPGTFSNAANTAALVSLLAGSPTGGNIVLTGASYDPGASTYFANPNGYSVYAATVGSATLLGGIESNASGMTYQGIVFAVTDPSRVFAPGGTPVIVSHWGGANMSVLDCAFSGGLAAPNASVAYGIWDQSPAGMTVERCTFTNFTDGGLRYDNNSVQPYSSSNTGTPVVSSVTDLTISNICRVNALSGNISSSVTTIPLTGDVTYSPVLIIGTEIMTITGGWGTNSLTVVRGAQGTSAAAHTTAAIVFTPYDSNGTAEAGLITGHPASNPVARIQVTNSVTCSMLTLLNTWNTTFTDLSLDNSGLFPTAAGSGVAIYNEHYTYWCLFTRFKITASREGCNSEWDDGTTGNAGGHFNTYTVGIVSAVAWLGGGSSAGFFFDQGSESPTVTFVTMTGQSWAGIGFYNGIGSVTRNNNVYPGGAVPDYTTSHI
jgi:hypothetical protein